MLFRIYVKQQRLRDEVWEIFCSQGQDARIRRNIAVIEVFDFPHIEGNLNEEKHISQANQLHIPVIASARSAVLTYRTAGCNVISTPTKRRWNLQRKPSMQKDQITRPESCFTGQNLFIIQFCL